MAGSPYRTDKGHFAKGHHANPDGRPKGSKNKLKKAEKRILDTVMHRYQSFGFNTDWELLTPSQRIDYYIKLYKIRMEADSGATINKKKIEFNFPMIDNLRKEEEQKSLETPLTDYIEIKETKMKMNEEDE